MEKRLDFDRGMIMLANNKKTQLYYTRITSYNVCYTKLLRIIATHDKDLIKKTGGRVLLLKQGRLEGSTFTDKHYDKSIF